MKINALGPIIVSVLACSGALAASSPKIEWKGDSATIVLPEEAKQKLQRVYPSFKPWRVSDFAPSVVDDDIKNRRSDWAPFALVTDVNGDRVDDVILDGHTDSEWMLLALVSDEGDYRVVTINRRETADPKTIEFLNEGKVEHGLGCYIWPEKNRLPKSAKSEPRAFNIICPQQSDGAGNAASDGGFSNYFYHDGQFERDEHSS
jgi:hypothetical protein